MTGSILRGRGLIGGSKTGEALVSTKPFTFAHGVDPSSGVVTDVRSDIRGARVKGKVLFYPYGKGSTTASAWFLETVRLGNGPSALITEGLDLSGVIGSVMARLIYEREIPIVSGISRESYSAIKPGTTVMVEGDRGEVTVG